MRISEEDTQATERKNREPEEKWVCSTRDGEGALACEIEIVCTNFFANCCNGNVVMEGGCRYDSFLPLQGIAEAGVVAKRRLRQASSARQSLLHFSYRCNNTVDRDSQKTRFGNEAFACVWVHPGTLCSIHLRLSEFVSTTVML